MRSYCSNSSHPNTHQLRRNKGVQCSRSDSRQLSVVLQVYNQDTLETIHYACSNRVIPVGTARLNARRLVRMLRQPIIGLTSRQMWDFGSDARVRGVQSSTCSDPMFTIEPLILGAS